MALHLSLITLYLAGLFQEGGGEPETTPVYQLAGLTWWGGLLLVGAVILVAWILISWQAAHFDRQMASESPGEHPQPGEGLEH